MGWELFLLGIIVVLLFFVVVEHIKRIQRHEKYLKEARKRFEALLKEQEKK